MPAITIRNVPENVRNTLAARAARRGQSMQEYLRGMLVSAADKPDLHEWLERTRDSVERDGTRLSAAEILDDLRATRRGE